MGHVSDVFPEKVLRRMPGRRAVGHTRYSTAGSSVLANAQPIVVKTSMGPLGIVHNGNLTNPVGIRNRLEAEGSIFQTTSDTEVILHLMARNPRRDVVESFMLALEQVEGAYSLLMVTDNGLIAARDPNGFRPLVLGDLDGAPCFASESGPFDLLGARTVRELEPGEVVVARNGQVETYRQSRVVQPARCIFEHVYFARPDSKVFGDAVSQTRLRMGARLAREAPAVLIAGKRVVLIDDSIVRGTTSRKIVGMVKDAGAAEVHVRISAPPTQWPCHYGIDTPTRDELIAAHHTVEEIRQFIGADSLAYLSLDGMLASVSGPRDSYCTACWTGDYPVSISPEDRRQAELFPIRVSGGVD
jgi:amidophosphoribosyltransferase